MKDDDQLSFYVKEDLEHVSSMSFWWGVFAGVGSSLIILGSIYLVGLYVP